MSQIIMFGAGVVPPGTYIQQIDGDVGFVSGSVVSFNATPTAGSTIQFSGSGTTMLFEVTDGDNNTIMGNGSGNSLISGTDNTGFGNIVLPALTTGNENTAVGMGALNALEDGSGNTAIGQSALPFLVSGDSNTVLGGSSALAYAGSESFNIVIGNSINGTLGESNVLRIGSATGTGLGKLNAAYIQGIRGITAATADQVLINTSFGQIVSIPAGTTGQILTAQGAGANPIWVTNAAIEQIDGDVGSVSGSVVSFNATLTAGSTIQFSGSGTTMLFEVTDGDNNTIMGNSAGNGSLSGENNTSVGAGNFVSLTSGDDNSAFGQSVLIALEDGSGNTAVGQLALFELVDGNDNTVIGSGSGGSYTSSESNNIILGASINGTLGESNVLRIGSGTGTGQGQLNQTYIQGIRGITAAAADQVLINTSFGQIVSIPAGTSGFILTAQGIGANPIWAAPAASSISITGNSGGALVGNAFTFTGGTTGLLFSGAGTTETLTGTLVVSNGGTGNNAFTAYSVITAGTTATGPLQNVSGVGTAGQVLTSNGAAALPSWQAAGSGGITDIDGDTGTATGSTITFTATPSAGSSISFDAAGAGVALNVTDASDNTLFGFNAGNGTLSGDANTGFGQLVLGALTTGSFNTGVGQAVLGSLEDGGSNTGIGYQALSQLVSGNGNVCIGHNAGSAYTTTETGNIIIGAGTNGTVGESDVIRIGEPGNINATYIAGIATVAVSNKEYVTIDTTTGQLGSDSGPSGGLAWSVITANQTAAVNNGYICNKAGTLALALPATSAVGDIIEVTGINTALGWQITQAAGQQIFFGATQTTSGATGTLTSSATRDALRIVCIATDTTWQVLSVIGNISVV